MTPSKFTPFARQGNANKGAPDKNAIFATSNNENKNPNVINRNNQGKFNSHRMLNYELSDNVDIMKSNIAEF